MLCFVRRLLLFAREQPIFGCSFGLLSQFVRGLALCPAAATTFLANRTEILFLTFVLWALLQGAPLQFRRGTLFACERTEFAREWTGVSRHWGN